VPGAFWPIPKTPPSRPAAPRGEIGELRIGFTSSLPLTPILPAALHAYRQHYPAVRLTLREMFTTDQFTALQQQEIDVGFVRFNGLSRQTTWCRSCDATRCWW
jgi:DNA-binding transcriptional LysR family regulator